VDAEAVGRRLRVKRKSLKFSQAQLAEASGIHPQSISEYERGRRIPYGNNLVRLARALDMTDMELLVGLKVPRIMRDEAYWQEVKRRMDSSPGQASVLDAVVWHGLERSGGLIQGVKALVDILRGLDRKEAELALTALEAMAKRARDRMRNRNPLDK
jgi:transcriptional regulator with XRE-family HTH domain